MILLFKKFEQDCLHDTDTLWELSRAPEVETYLNKYCSKDDRDLGLDVINAFKRDISPVLNSFQKGSTNSWYFITIYEILV